MLSIHNNKLFVDAMYLADKGDFKSANDLLLKLRKIYPSDPTLMFYIGLTHLNLEEFENAVRILTDAVQQDADNYLALQALGTAYYSIQQHDLALINFNRAIQLNPKYSDVHNDKALSLMALGRFNEALSSISLAIHLDPNYIDAISNKGMNFYWLGRYVDALDCFDHAISKNDQVSEVFANKGVTLAAIGNYDEAIECYKRSLELNPENAESHRFLSLVYLNQFEFRYGWDEFEWRLLCKSFKTQLLITSKPKWMGVNKTKRLLIWSEQGIGDQVLFASLLSELSTHQSQITVAVDEKLVPLFKRSFDNLNIISSKTSFDEFDEHLSFGSLGLFFRPSIESFPNVFKPYLIEDQLLRNRIRQLVTLREQKEKVRCGISWHSVNKEIGNEKSIKLSSFSDILNLDNVTFINLQYGDNATDIAALDSSLIHKIHSLPEFDLYSDIDSVVSLINACDVIVTISNTTAHLAGALGKKVLLLLPYALGQIWYWSNYNGRSLWYPSVILFRQTVAGDWTEPLGNVKKYLEENFD